MAGGGRGEGEDGDDLGLLVHHLGLGWEEY